MKRVIGIFGAGENASEADIRNARALGEMVAAHGWVVLTGGRAAGVMLAAVEGAKQIAGSLTIGILPGPSKAGSADVDIAVVTGMGNARNNINVLCSDVVVACGTGGAGTVSEIALALKNGKPVVIVGARADASAFLQNLGGSRVQIVERAEDALAAIERLLAVS